MWPIKHIVISNISTLRKHVGIPVAIARYLRSSLQHCLRFPSPSEYIHFIYICIYVYTHIGSSGFSVGAPTLRNELPRNISISPTNQIVKLL